MKSAKEIIGAILLSYSYNRDSVYMVRVCEEVKKRLKKEDTSPILRTDDGDIIYGTLVCLYGEYGTSPRSGWFVPENKQVVDEIIEAIDEEIKEINQSIEMEVSDESN